MDRSRNAVLGLVLALLGFGVVMIYSASGVLAERQARFGDSLFFVRKQLIWVGLSLTVLLASSWMPARFWRRSAPWLFLLSLALLAAVLVPGIGTKLNGARRWFRLGDVGLQPSEMAKLTLVMFLAWLLDRDPERMRSLLKGTLPTMGAVALACAMVVVEPDVGTAVFLAVVATLLLLGAGLRFWHTLPPALFAVPMLGWALSTGLLATQFPHLEARIRVFLDPGSDPQGKGYQIGQSLIALGSGGTWGTGLGLSKQKLLFLPEANTDFIFAVVGEELGFAGAAALLVGFLVLLWRLRQIAMEAKRPFGHFVALGVMLLLGLQTAMNVGVVTASLPNKGIPLPFVSFGGSSLVFTCLAVGVALAATREEGAEGLASESLEGP
ncbi:MAG: putative lipid II flippase FtsW [Planctomycetota bacterium]